MKTLLESTHSPIKDIDEWMGIEQSQWINKKKTDINCRNVHFNNILTRTTEA